MSTFPSATPINVLVALFGEYEKTRSTSKKKALVAENSTALSLQAQIEEEIFHPAVREEQNGVFPGAKPSSPGLLEPGVHMATRKDDLLARPA